MALFGRKKEETKKEYEDIQQIKDAIDPSETPTVSQVTEEPTFTDEWRLQDRSNVWASKEFPASAPAQASAMPPSRIEAIQTPNVSRSSMATTATASMQKNAVQDMSESVPLFIKLDRYRNILHTLSDLKTTVTKVKNAFELFSEMERIKGENLRVLEAAVQKVEARLGDLDSEFIRPTGLKEPEQREGQEGQYEQQEWASESENDEGLRGMITDLRSQIEKLKEELDQISPSQQQAAEE